MCGCSRDTGKSQAPGSSIETSSLSGVESQMTTSSRFPILSIERAAGDDALLGYKLTDEESSLFKKMDAAVVSLGQDIELEACHRAVIAIGKQHGLSEEQSIAFWTRTTFSMFEP